MQRLLIPASSWLDDAKKAQPWLRFFVDGSQMIYIIYE